MTTRPFRLPPPQLVVADTGCAEVCGNLTVKQSQRSSSRTSTSSSQRQLLKQAVLQRSGGLPRPKQMMTPPPGPDTADLLHQHHSQVLFHSVDAGPTGLGSSYPSPPRPLFPPTTLIVGDSITRDICYFSAITRCYPKAKVKDITGKLPGLLESLPFSVARVIVHVGGNDTSCQQSERTKKDFNVFSFSYKVVGFQSASVAPAGVVQQH